MFCYGSTRLLQSNNGPTVNVGPPSHTPKQIIRHIDVESTIHKFPEAYIPDRKKCTTTAQKRKTKMLKAQMWNKYGISENTENHQNEGKPAAAGKILTKYLEDRYAPASTYDKFMLWEILLFIVIYSVFVAWMWFLIVVLAAKYFLIENGAWESLPLTFLHEPHGLDHPTKKAKKKNKLSFGIGKCNTRRR